jgi:hypothetical protein
MHPVVDDHRLALCGGKGRAAEDALIAITRFQRGRVVAPVEQIPAAGVSPTVALLVLEDVHQVIGAPVEDGAVGVERHGNAFGADKVVARPLWIGQQPGAQGAGVGDLLRRLIGCWVLHRLLSLVLFTTILVVFWLSS